jgi:competence ComEA-like helix-hairpin-helix protein
MKLSSAEGKAVSFILLMIAVSALAKILSRKSSAEVTVTPVAAGILDAAAPRSSTKKKAPKQPARLPPLGPDERVDPNRATVPELERLPGVGPTLAAAIVKDRERNGPFLSTLDLARVKGLSLARARALSPHLDLPKSIDDPTPSSSLPARPILLNSATPADLDRIEGISAKLAQRIIAARDSLRGFRDWHQIDAIPGVGPKLLARLKERTALGR